MMGQGLTPQELVEQVQRQLLPLADGTRAPGMAAYMKNHFGFLGINAPARRGACAGVIREAKVLDGAQLLQAAQQLWQLEAREYQYVAVDLLARQHKKLGMGDVPALLALVQSKSWWDSVDGLAGVIGDVLLVAAKAANVAKAGFDAHAEMDAALLHADFWVQRIALLHQLGWREQVDKDRLARYCLHLAGEKEFFIRKAIGWALRDYAWHEPEWVRQFLALHREKLSGLSVREAGKHL